MARRELERSADRLAIGDGPRTASGSVRFLLEERRLRGNPQRTSSGLPADASDPTVASINRSARHPSRIFGSVIGDPGGSRVTEREAPRFEVARRDPPVAPGLGHGRPRRIRPLPRGKPTWPDEPAAEFPDLPERLFPLQQGTATGDDTETEPE